MIPENILILPNYSQAFFLQVLVHLPDENRWELKSFQDVIPSLGMPQGTITGIASGRAAHFQKEGAVLGRFYRIDGPEGYLMISVPAGHDPSGKYVYLTRVMRLSLSELGDGAKTPVVPPINLAELGILGGENQEYPLTLEQKKEIELAFNYLNGLSRLPPDANCDAIGTMLGDVMLHQELQILSSVPSPAGNNMKIEGEAVNNGRTILMVVCIGMLFLFIIVIFWHNHASKPVKESPAGNNAASVTLPQDSGEYSDSPFDPSVKHENGKILPDASSDASNEDASDEDADDSKELVDLSKEEKKEAKKEAESMPEGTQSEPAEVLKDQAQNPEIANPANPLPLKTEAAAKAAADQAQERKAIEENANTTEKADLAQDTPQTRTENIHADNQSTHSVNGAPIIEDDSNDDGDQDMMADPKNTQDNASDPNEVVLPAGPKADKTVASEAPEQTADGNNQSKVNPFSANYETQGTSGAVLVDDDSGVPTNPADGNGTSANAAANGVAEADGASVPGEAAKAAGTAQAGSDVQKAKNGTLAQRDNAEGKDFAKGVVEGANAYE